MSRPPIFNDYDANGYRTNCVGCRSSRTEDEAICYNLRHTWGARVAHLSDTELVNEYDRFAMSDMFGNNDERWMEWLGTCPQCGQTQGHKLMCSLWLD